MTAADQEVQNELPAARQRLLLLVPRLLIVAGAALGLLALIYDYFAIPDAVADFAGNRSFGLKQLLALAAGAGSMAAGVVLSLIVEPGRRTETLRFWAVAAQVGLLVATVRLYEIENLAFYELVFPLIGFGFVIHHHLSAELRKPFFFALALACYLGVFASANLVAGFWLIGLALSLIVIASLPISAWIRAALLVAAGVGFAAMRLGWIDTGWSGVILPVLSSMFIFRAAIYLYDTASGKGPTSWWQRLSYFFLPPNVVFPFFPVVDYATFGRTYYNEDASRIYQRGASWIIRGLVHLVVYRVVYLYGVISPESVEGAGDFVRYIVANFGLYLRISGLFHLIVGTILLFGYNLPETHTRFYFSNSFIDFWRRINIYWKDFMQKMVFTPAFMRLRRLGTPQLVGIVASMFAVFFATWALHAYQWFWLRGTMLFTVPDMLFWGGLAVLLAVQTIHESRPKPAQGAVAGGGVLGPRALLVLRTVCTFFTICLMWSLWTSETFGAWGELWIRSGLTPAFDSASAGGVADWALTLVTIAVVVFATAISAGFTFGLARPAVSGLGARKRAAPARPMRAAATGAAAILALILVQTPALLDAVGNQAQTFAEDMRRPRLNRGDQAAMDRGYYENLTGVNNFNSRLWELYMARPNGRSRVADAPFIRQRSDALEYDFLPGSSAMFNGVTYDINRWGMRDVDVTKEKPEGVFRIGLNGSSQVSGWGVELEDRFDKILAASLNGAEAEDARYETLNFAVDGYELTERVVLLDEKAWDFDLDALLIFSQVTRDLNVEHLAKMYVRGTPPDYPFIRAAFERAGVTPDMTEAEVVSRLLDQRYDIVRDAYAHEGERARELGVTAVWVYMPLVEPQRDNGDAATLRRFAEEAGLATIDLSGVFEGRDARQLQIAPWDNHPNAAGHRLMAEALEQGLRDLEAQGRIDFDLLD